jgi:hypothetical protein
VLADRTHDDYADAVILVQRLEHQAQLVALRHRYDVEGRPVQDARSFLFQERIAARRSGNRFACSLFF